MTKIQYDYDTICTYLQYCINISRKKKKQEKVDIYTIQIQIIYSALNTSTMFIAI